ncbi:uncharacterized protein LOC122502231 isoform X2 [Leptopilina heterotoma]|uniref:uncharacterized protein LOC122502231 isoform X2 n=1 Tax=Leptopilina heterotoma TaxID=63436 RepID=UPI001CA99ED7|nr:uncharacterized protein LOC122502231 isoform X2 [Leptopilina heterotoma]
MMSSEEVFLVGVIDNQIIGSKLPSKRNCLSVLFYNMRVSQMNQRDSAALVIENKNFNYQERKSEVEDKKEISRDEEDLTDQEIVSTLKSINLNEDELLDKSNSSLESDATSTFSLSFKPKRGTRHILTERLCAAFDKCKVSDRDVAHILMACVIALDLDPSEFIINRSSIKRKREEFRKESAIKTQNEFMNSNTEFVVVHWDSKILPDLSGKESVDRLPVIVMSQDKEQLLGVPKLSSATGEEVACAVYEILMQWSLENKIQALVFDTTASNSGRLNGACVLLEQKLNRDILFLAYRHHIYEIMLASVFEEPKLSFQTGPDIQIFKKFQKIGQKSIKLNILLGIQTMMYVKHYVTLKKMFSPLPQEPPKFQKNLLF